MKNFLSRFKALPLKTRQLLSLGVVLALFVGLPLFVWAVVTQRFELRKKAAIEPKTLCVRDSDCGCALDIDTSQCAVENNLYLTSRCTLPDFCTGISGDLTPACVDGQCTLTSRAQIVSPQPEPTPTTCPGGPVYCPAPPPGCNYLNFCDCQLTCPAQIVSPQPKPTSTPCTATPRPNPCAGQPDGTTCSGGGCDPCVGVCTRPVFSGACQNQVCTPTVPAPSCPSGDQGNLNCDASSLINATDLSILLSQWRIGACPAPAQPEGRHSSDLNGDCNINATDLSILLSNWKPN